MMMMIIRPRPCSRLLASVHVCLAWSLLANITQWFTSRSAQHSVFLPHSHSAVSQLSSIVTQNPHSALNHLGARPELRRRHQQTNVHFTGPSTDADRTENSRFPARQVCEIGWYDIDADACVYYDKRDAVLPRFTCPEGAVLDGNFCYGRILSDFELDCPKHFPLNLDSLCVRAILYIPARLVCPEGFEIRTYTGARLKQCVKVRYVPPVKRPIETEEAIRIATEARDKKGGRDEIGDCDGIHDRYCPKPPKRYTADKDYVLECPEGRLVQLKNTPEAVCKVRVVVPADTRETCKKGYSWTTLEGAGSACLRLTAFDSVKVCPGPTPKFGPGFGDWETPSYQYDQVDRCVAYKAKAIGGECPEGYVLEKETCYRKIYLPYYMDCNNAEGYGFSWNERERRGECVFLFNPFKWSAGANYLTKRDQFENTRTFLFSNPFEVKRAYLASQPTAAAAVR